MMLLTSCSTTSNIKTVYLFPPSVYLIPCEQSLFTGSTYGEAILYLRTVMKERDVCASRINGIREWLQKTEIEVTP